MTPRLSMRYVTKPAVEHVARGIGVAAAMFAGLGTVAALWENPFFMRMTPAGSPEITLLFALSALAGVYVSLPRAACARGAAGTGGVIGFLGIACPVCNKILVLLFGSSLLLQYFEPGRLYLAVSGALLLAVAIWLKAVRRGCAQAETPMGK
jgi:hypothetical protein